MKEGDVLGKVYQGIQEKKNLNRRTEVRNEQRILLTGKNSIFEALGIHPDWGVLLDSEP